MRVEVGYSECTDTEKAGREAASQAIAKAGRQDPCELVMLFSTAAHEPEFLRSVVASVFGGQAAIVGGGGIGAITNETFGYCGAQVGLAAVWMDGQDFELFSESGLVDFEEEVGERMGEKLAAAGVTANSPLMMFYDGINRSNDNVRLNLATPMLQGLSRGIGYLPSRLVGAGLQAGFDCPSYPQWNGSGTEVHQAMMLKFSDKIKIDSVIMHGCRPSGGYYTVTKSDKQTILEVNGQPALPLMASIAKLKEEELPFFVIFGVNRSDPRSRFNEKNYANRLCLGIDRERNGIVMFESDMVPGTRFQIMQRSLDLDYIPPKINGIFNGLGRRKPVFAFYIDCAGRAARDSGELEDAVMVQKAVAGRAPLLGIYSGVEIAPIMGQPRTLDWTGVFCLFSEEA